MASSPSSRISFFTTTGLLIQGPIEGHDCGISIDIPKEFQQLASLKVESIQLPLWFTENSLCALSAWPASGPGQFQMTLECGDIQEHRIITILPRYFTETEISNIFHELTSQLPISITSSLQQCGKLKEISISSKYEPSVEQQYHRLNKAIRGTKDRLGIIKLLQMIQRECHHVLVTRLELRATNKARRPDISKLPQVISMPGNIGPGGYIEQLFDQTVERSYETYENRLVKAYVQALQSQLLRLNSRLEETKGATALAEKVEELTAEFQLACSRTQFLKQVRLPFVSAGRITMVLLKKTAYRAVLEDYLGLYKQTSARLEEPRLSTPLNEFPYLYQLWANFKVIKVMLQICAEAGYRCINHNWVKSDENGVYFDQMKDFTTALDLSSPKTGKMVKLLPWTPETGRTDAKYGQELPPALAICVYAPGKPPMVLMFDAKYRTFGDNEEITAAQLAAGKSEAAKNLSLVEPVPEHIEELRGAMKAVKTPTGVSEIRYAAILYPGLSKQIERKIEAMPARPENPQDTEEGFESRIAKILNKFLL